MKLFFKKTILVALVAALGLAAMPFTSASAAGRTDPTTPPQGEISDERLERAWARQLRTYERIGRGFERNDVFIDRAQNLIDKAAANGKDVSALQAALDAFQAAVKVAHPVYESANGIVKSHHGFDVNGKVTDPAKAKETVTEMSDKLQEIKSAMDGTGQALREAIKAFREANPRPQPSATPEGI
jgi:phage-related tail protein